MNDDDIAAKLYPSMPFASEPNPEPTPTQETLDPLAQDAEKVFPSMQEEAPQDDSNVPKEIRELRQADQDRKMFSPQQTYKNDIKDTEFDGVEDISTEEKAQVVHEFREMAADHEMNSQEITLFRDLLNEGFLNPPTADEMIRQEAESIQLVKDKYGADADRVLKLARKLSLRDRRIADLIKAAKIGNNPKLVSAYCDKALSLLAKGKLK